MARAWECQTQEASIYNQDTTSTTTTNGVYKELMFRGENNPFQALVAST